METEEAVARVRAARLAVMRFVWVVQRRWFWILVFLPLIVASLAIWNCLWYEASCKAEARWTGESTGTTDTTEYRDSTVTITYKRHAPDGNKDVSSTASAEQCSFSCYIVKKSLDDPIALFTGGLLWVTWALAIFTFQLWRGAVDQGDLAHRAFVADKRAFIYPTELHSEAEVVGGYYAWRFRPLIKNSGTTATKKVWMYSKCVVLPETIEPSYGADPFFSEFPDEPRAGFIAPQQEVYSDISPRPPLPGISADDLAAAQRGEKFIYLVGTCINKLS